MYGTFRRTLRQKTSDLNEALTPARDHALASVREAMLAISSLFQLLAQGCDHLRTPRSVPSTDLGAAQPNGL
jgi:hypothetical protein